MPVRVDENSQANATIQVTRKKMVVRARPIRETEIASASVSGTKTYGRSSTVFPRAVRNSIRWSERLNQSHRFDSPVSRPEHEFASLFVVSPARLFENCRPFPRWAAAGFQCGPDAGGHPGRRSQ